MNHQQATPTENLIRAKKNKYNYNVSSEAFSLDGRQFVLYNISLKKDYTDSYDYINYRRGLTYIEEIVNFQHTELTVARKGLRKFKDLMAEYLDIKESHVNTSKFHNSEKNRLFKNLQNTNFNSYLIYNTEKVNGQNAQISVVCDKYWLIGSKNKCLLAYNEEDLEKLKNKHQYKQISLIAKCWFNILKTKTEEEITLIKSELANKTLIGEYCNMENMQHLVNYGQQPLLLFYALVQKDNLDQDCCPISTTYKFLENFKLPKVKVQIHQTKTFDHTIEELRKIVVKMNQMTMKEGGQGSVLYISGVDQKGQHNQLICKVKTIEYRIFRKLREKLKVYLQKYNKNFDNLLKKYSKEIGEIARQFSMIRPLSDYVELARRAFSLCEDQNRPISKFITNRFIDFLYLLQKNISKQKFLEIVKGSSNQLDDNEQEQEQQIKKQQSHQKQNQQETTIPPKQQSEEQRTKNVLVLIPLTIPSSGKTTLLQVIKTHDPSFRIWSISSDQCRKQIMDDLMKKSKNLNKKQAFERSGDKANKLFYSKMGQVFKNISMSKEKNHLFFIDKNHPESAIKPSIKNISQKSQPFKNLKIKKVCLLSQYSQRLAEKGKYSYPFSAAYVITCLKRVLNRPEHLTLEGSQQERCNIVIGFSNLFRNFSLSPFNLTKYFDQKISFSLNNENCLKQENDKNIVDLFKEILLRGKPGKFDEVHPKLEILIEVLKKWELIESQLPECAKSALIKLQNLFNNFDGLTFEKQENKQ